MRTELGRYKRMAAEAAVEMINPGALVGLGHGSTAAFAISRIEELFTAGKLPGLRAVPCSGEVSRLAGKSGIRLLSREECRSFTKGPRYERQGG